MRPAALAGLLAVLAAATTTASAAARFTGNVCGLLTNRQLGAIPGLSTKCASARPTRGAGSTL